MASFLIVRGWGGSAESDWGSLVTRKNQDITRLLKNVNDHRSGALDNLMRAVYDDLQHVAERHMTQRFGHDLPGVTLEPAALVNESFLKIIKQRNTYDNRGPLYLGRNSGSERLPAACRRLCGLSHS